MPVTQAPGPPGKTGARLLKAGVGALAALFSLTVLGASASAAVLPLGPPAPLPGPVNLFVFSGALEGALHLEPKTGCQGAGPAGVTLNLQGPLHGGKATSWVIQVLSIADGSYDLKGNSVIGVTVSDAQGDVQWGLDARGDLTVDGTTGMVKAGLTGTNGTFLRVVGSWSCPSS